MNFDRCNCEHRIPGSRPFYFDYTGQKIILITSVPSFQAVYRQLASIRFFRHVFLSLFGSYPTIGNQSHITFFHDNIYWTHYHKCYLPKDDPIYSYKNPPEICRETHLNKEIDDYKPEIIVIFGAAIVHRLTGKVLNEDYMETIVNSLSGRSIPCVCTDFPETGAEEVMVKVRKRIEKIISEIDISPVLESMISPRAYEKDTFKVHAEYELDALRYYWNAIKINSRPIFVGEKNIDDIWIEKEVIPKWVYNSFIVTCCAFIEDQVNALLAENQDLVDLLYSNKFLRCLRMLFERYGMQYLLDNKPPLLDEIDLLRKIRNKIVHQGGIINHERDVSLNHTIQARRGLDMEPSGHIIVSEQFCEQALAIVQRFVRCITRFDTKY